MKGEKNDYSMSFWKGKERVLFLPFVHDTDKAIAWTDQEKIDWEYANVYERRTRKFLIRIKR